MIPDFNKTGIYIRPGSTDMRKQIAGLSAITEDQMKHDPLSGCLFLFCSKNRKLLKCIYWDCNGFCLWMKRLEQDKFPWPQSETEAQKISNEELNMLLKGIDFFQAHKTIKYQKID